jgi:LysR family transcriptional regulator for bpeEF and oprC
MDRLNAINIFVRVVDKGSFSAVSQELRIGQSTVSKQIAALESHLGAQLISRTSRRMNLTEAGRDFYESAVRLMEEVETAESRVGRGQISPYGLVRFSMPPVFAGTYVAPHLRKFFARYPDITLELFNHEHPVSLLNDGLDLAVHHGPLADSSLVIKKIAAVSFVTVATPEYLEKHGTPKTPDDLDKHNCIVFIMRREHRAWAFKGKRGNIAYQPRGFFRTNAAEHIHSAVMTGLGLAHTPIWLFLPEIISGKVKCVLNKYEITIPISAVRPGDKRLATKVRVLIDFLAEIFAKEKILAIR